MYVFPFVIIKSIVRKIKWQPTFVHCTKSFFLWHYCPGANPVIFKTWFSTLDEGWGLFLPYAPIESIKQEKKSRRTTTISLFCNRTNNKDKQIFFKDYQGKNLLRTQNMSTLEWNKDTHKKHSIEHRYLFSKYLVPNISLKKYKSSIFKWL